MVRTIAGLVGLAAMLAVAAVEAAPTTSVRGVVMRGPIAPVCVDGRPCSAPLAFATIVFSQSGTEVARVSTNERGRFSLRLAPGAYRIRLLRQGPLMRLSPQVVRVPSSRRVWLRLDVDTGIRAPGPVGYG